MLPEKVGEYLHFALEFYFEIAFSLLENWMTPKHFEIIFKN